MANPDDTDTETTQDISVRFPRDFVTDELMPVYPSATKPTDAIRMAVQNDVERRKEAVTPSDIRDSVVEALEDFGGSYESIQRLTINSVEDLEVNDVENVNVRHSEREE